MPVRVVLLLESAELELVDVEMMVLEKVVSVPVRVVLESAELELVDVELMVLVKLELVTVALLPV